MAGLQAIIEPGAIGFIDGLDLSTPQPPLEVRNPAQLRDLAASAARIFGWVKKEGLQTHINQLCITAEQLEQIRQLRGATVYEAPHQEGPQPFPASSGSVGYEVVRPLGLGQ